MTTTTTITPTLNTFPWQGLGDQLRDRSVVPRAELQYFALAAAITDGDATGQQLNIGCDLPGGFSYTLSSFSLVVSTTATLGSWDTVGYYAFINNGGGVNTTNGYYGQIQSDGVVNSGSLDARVYEPIRGMPPQLLMCPGDGDVKIQVKLRNRTGNETDQNVSVLIRLLRYDISQAYHWEPNTPTLIR